MPVSFTKAAITQAVGALLGTLIRFGIISAVLSLTLYLVAWSSLQVQIHTGTTPFFLNTTGENLFPVVPNVNYVPQNIPSNLTLYGFLRVFNPQDYLSQFPPFKYLGYIQIMWYVLLVPIFLGGAVYMVILSQGSGMSTQQIVDYYSDVAWPTLVVTGAFIMMWLLVGAIVLIGMAAFPQNLFSQGILGLIRLGTPQPYQAIQTIFTQIYPYLPIPVELGAFVYLLKEVHTGWVGNQW